MAQRLEHIPGIALSILLGVGLVTASGGCGGRLFSGGAGGDAVTFATGELRSTEEAPLAQVATACRLAIDRLGYEDVEVEREADQTRFRARTVGGEPVDIRALTSGPERTDLRIRIGILGDETTSRLLLEEIHQSL